MPGVAPPFHPIGVAGTVGVNAARGQLATVPQQQSRETIIAYNRQDRIEGHVPDGHVDPGERGRILGDGRVRGGSRERMLVDRQNDARWQEWMATARDIRARVDANPLIPDHLKDRVVATRLMGFVAETMTHPNPLLNNTNWVALNRGNEVRLGDVPNLGRGVCRHRATLFSVLAEEAGLQVSLVRGRSLRAVHHVANPNASGNKHVWNEVRLGNQLMIVDAMQSPHAFRDPQDQATILRYQDRNGRRIYE